MPRGGPRSSPRTGLTAERDAIPLPGLSVDPLAPDPLDEADASLDGIFERASARLPFPVGVRANRSRHASVGINAPKLLEYETGDGARAIYGSTASILDDLGALGVGIVRQPSNADLGWPRDVEVPQVANGEEMYTAAFQETPKANLAALFEEMRGRSSPQKVVLTLFSGGSNNFKYTEPSGEYDTSVGVGGLTWPSTHAGVALSLWDTATTYTINEYVLADLWNSGGTGTYSTDPASADYQWYMGSLDLRSRYKLKYIYYIGYAIGRLLIEVNGDYRTTHGEDIWDMIEALEVFNESNHANPFFNNYLHPRGFTWLMNSNTVVETQARFWSLGVREMVRGIQHVFAGETRSFDGGASLVPLTLPLWMPSLAMYFDTGTIIPDDVHQGEALYQATFANTLLFQEKLCHYLLQDFATDATDNPDAAALACNVDFSWFTNQDYHYYNYKDNQSPGLILRLAAEVQALRRTFRSVAHGGLDVIRTAGHPVTISVCENGAAANLANIPYANTFFYMDPAGTSTSPEQFQAREVWRRLAVAATGGRYVAWHTHMSYRTGIPDDTTGFSYMGLREDDLGANPSITTASLVTQRLSWWAYQRFASLAVDDGTSPFDGQIVARFATTLPSTTDYFQGANLADVSFVGIAIHFIRSATEHYYLLMIDPSVDHRSWADLHVTLRTLDGVAADFSQLYTIPAVRGTVTTPTDTSILPTETADSSWDAVIPDDATAGVYYTQNTASYTVPQAFRPDMDPVLVRCTAPVTVTWA